MHTKSSIPSTWEIIFAFVVVLLLCLLFFASDKAKGDKSTATLGGKLSFVFLVLVAMTIGIALSILFPRHRSYALHASPQEIAKIEAEGGPASPAGPRLRPDSTARFGDTVKIVCGSAFCAAALTQQGAEASHPAPKSSTYQVQSGTEAVVTLYDPPVLGTNTAKIDLINGPHADEAVWIPGKWMHKL